MLDVKGIIWSNLGHCIRCMRRSFQVAAITSFAFTLTVFWLEPGWTTNLLGSIAFLAICLWAAHILVFATKGSIAASQRERKQADFASRRDVALLFTKLLAVAAAGTATPAFAQTCPDGRSPCFSGTCCGSDQKCCCTYPTSKYCEAKKTPCVC
jgi:hypothetical protein